MVRALILVIALAAPFTANALEILACEPEWGTLAEEIAGDAGAVVVATTAFQDPHSLQAKPSLIAAARNADLLVCAGADLEIGWLPLLLRRSVRRLEIPRVVDRSRGDVHPQGNPHMHLGPRNIVRVAEALTNRLVDLDAANATVYRANLDDFLARWEAAVVAWEERAAPLAGMQLVSHHRSFSYLADWLDLDIVATLEPKPGIPPSGSQLARLLEQLTPQAPVAIIRAPFENEKPARWLSQRLGVPEILLPYTVGGSEQATDLFSLYEHTIEMLLEYMQ